MTDKDSLTIAAIRAALAQITDSQDPRLVQWQNDNRKGVRQLVERWQRQYAKQAANQAAFLERFSWERKLWQAGFTRVAGIDEVGRGPLAGPVVAAAVILPEDFDAPAVIDSKQLTATQRETLYQVIMDQAVAVATAFGSAQLIDQVNIYQATRQTMLAAVQQLNPQPDYLLIDAMQIDSPLGQESLIKGDARSNSIAAASIVAKVTRDHWMQAAAQKYPAYHFDKNAGYGTAEHLAALKKAGVTPLHRQTFAPVKDILNNK
ncbi:ribonuclease HII [Lactobacillaceae bacterium L1_55_11]|nr:ribonuclease HII [Lactobacillaceae bacterium L1_55_11]